MFLLFLVYRFGLTRVFYDVRGDEYEEISFFTCFAFVFKQPAKAWNIPKARGLYDRICNIISYEAADNYGVCILYRYHRLGRAFIRGGTIRRCAR